MVVSERSSGEPWGGAGLAGALGLRLDKRERSATCKGPEGPREGGRANPGGSWRPRSQQLPLWEEVVRSFS